MRVEIDFYASSSFMKHSVLLPEKEEEVISDILLIYIDSSFQVVRVSYLNTYL